MFAVLGNHNLYLNAAGLVSVGALALKDQIRLRGVLLVGLAFSLLSDIIGLRHPVWHELFWNTTSLAINLYVLTQLILDRTHIGLSHEQEKLFSALGVLKPGEFRSLVKVAEWRTAREGEVLTRNGVKPDHLYYVLDGAVRIAKGEREFELPPRVFIGEVAYLHRCPASATVSLGEGARYLRWDIAALERRLESRRALKSAMVRLLSLDTAQKVGAS